MKSPTVRDSSDVVVDRVALVHVPDVLPPLRFEIVDLAIDEPVPDGLPVGDLPVHDPVGDAAVRDAVPDVFRYRLQLFQVVDRRLVPVRQVPVSVAPILLPPIRHAVRHHFLRLRRQFRFLDELYVLSYYGVEVFLHWCSVRVAVDLKKTYRFG